MASGKVPEFKTLKECLEFLEWLKNNRGMQGQVANRLKRLLKDRYIKAKQGAIEQALSQFVGHVSNFHTKLCAKARASYNGHVSATTVLKSLIVCIPKLLSAIYFLRYKVDANFKALGGGEWAENQVGSVVRSAYLSSQIDKYLIATGSNNYGVIPGGFASRELNMGHRSGYTPAKNMAKHLETICEKQPGQFFRDIFVTSVFGNHGADTQNVANAVRLVEDFCRIFGTVADDDDLKQHLETNRMCIDWNKLKAHCSKLKMSLEKIFKENRFSFTGYGRKVEEVNTRKIAKKMATWLKNNLSTLKENLKAIETFDIRKLKLNMSHLKRSGLNPSQAQNVANYFTKNFFRYGFTFGKNKYEVKDTPYQELFDSWNGAIDMLRKDSVGDLDMLKVILDGNTCPNRTKEKQPKPKAVPNSEPERETEPDPDPDPGLVSEPEDDLDSELEFEPESESEDEDLPGENTETAKPVLTKTEATKSGESSPQTKSSEGAQNQGKKAEGAQNQGKKVEGAQNQGKKADSPQSQNNGQSEGTSPSLPDAQAVQIQPQTVSPSGTPSSGAADTGRDPSTGGQTNTSSAGQGNDKGTQRATGYDTAAPSTSNSGLGSGGPGGENKSSGCSSTSVNLGNHGGEVCRPKYTSNRRSLSDGLLKKLNDIMPPNGFTNTHKKSARPPTSTITASPPDSSWPAPGPSFQRTGDDAGHRRDYYKPQNRDAMQEDAVMAPSEITGYIIKDTSSKQLQEQMRRNGEVDKKRLELKRREEKRKFLNEVQEQWTKDSDTIQKEDDEWKKRKEDGRRQKQLDDFAKRQQEKRREGETRMENLLKWADHLKEMQKEGERKMLAVPFYADGFDARDPLEGSVVQDVEQRQRERNRFFLDRQRAFEQYLRDKHEAENDEMQKHADDLQKVMDHSDRLNNYGIVDVDIYGRQQSIAHDYIPPEPPTTDIVVQIPRKHGDSEQDSIYENPYTPSTPNIYLQITKRRNSLEPYDDTTEPTDLHISTRDVNPPDDLDVPKFFNNHPSNPYMPNMSFDIINPPERFKATVIEMDPFMDGSNIEISQPSTKANMDITSEDLYGKDPYDIDLQIQVPDRTLQDSSYDLNIDEPSPLHALQPLDPIDPVTTAINLNLEAPEPLPELPNKSAADYTHNPSTVQMCLSSWATSKPTPGSTDIPETELFPAEAPRTVRDMLQWLAGLKNPKHHKTLEKCINQAFSGLHKDTSQLALSVNGSYIIPKDVFDILQLTAMFASSVLSSIAPNWKAHVSSKTVQPRSSDEPDCCALLCQLRDYVYACCHQLEFLKAQCSRNELHGGWQDCKYGSEITSTNSPLQSFLTDGWDCPFETHPFDPCNLCLKSRVRMGFRDRDLPSSQQTGSTLSSILTPSCGGDDVRGGLLNHLTAHVIGHQRNLYLVYNIRCELPVGLLYLAAQ